MNSSTSHSKNLFGVLVASLVFSYAIGAAYTLFVNPEIQFWKEAYRVKLNHARALDATGQPKFVFAGGSSCAFQIDTEQLSEQFGIRAVNMGMHAGMGARVITALALQTLKPRDHFILNIEPSLLAREEQITPLGLQFLAATKNFHALSVLSSNSSPVASVDLLLSLRPGLRNAVTMLGKLLLSRPLYRYGTSDIHPGGSLTTSEKGAVPIRNVGTLRLSTGTKEWLPNVSASIQGINSDLHYLLPWMCVSPGVAPAARDSLQAFSDQVAEFAPILQDGNNGVDSHLEDFADTALHLNRHGAKRRTDLLGKSLMNPQESPKNSSHKAPLK